MAESIAAQAIQDSTSTSSTVTIVTTDTQDGEIPTVRLKLKKPKNDKKVQWSTETVDNEDMNKKKSKCCCIYTKAKKFDDSSSEESDDECDHCQGHVEKKKRKQEQDQCTTIESIPNPSDNNHVNSNNISPEPSTSN